MSKKFMIWCALFALLVGLVPPCSAKAETTETEWSNFGEYWLAQGHTIEDLPFEYDADKRYMYFKYTSDLYVILVFDAETDVSSMYHSGAYIYTEWTYKFAYRGTIGEWAGVTNGSYQLLNGDGNNVLYSDYCVPVKNASYCVIHKTHTGTNVTFEYALADMTDSLKATLQGYEYYVVAKVPYRVNDYKSKQIMIAVSNADRVIYRDESCNQIWFSTGSGKEAGQTYLYHSDCCCWMPVTMSNGYIIGDTAATGGGYPDVLWTNCDIYYEDGTSYALTDEIWFEALPYDGVEEEEETKEVVTDGFPRMFEVDCPVTYIYEEASESSTRLLALLDGKGGIIDGVTYDSNGKAWYSTSVYSNGITYTGYIPYDTVSVGASAPSSGSGESENTPTPTPTTAPTGGTEDSEVVATPTVKPPITAGQAYVNADLTGVYEEATDSSQVQHYLYKGSEVYVMECVGEEWYYIKYYANSVSQTGYIKVSRVDYDEDNGYAADTGSEILDRVSDMLTTVTGVPQVIAVMFSFLPPWCLAVVGVGFSLLVVLILYKCGRG